MLLVAFWAFSVAATKRKAARRETLAPTISLPIIILVLRTTGQAKAGINPRTPKKLVLCDQQLLQSGLLGVTGVEVEGAEVAQLFLLAGGGGDNLSQVVTRLGRAAAPNDIAAARRIPFVSNSIQPSLKEAIPLLVGSDAERFDVPAIAAIMLHG